jgi:dihydrofolate reductase
MITLIVAYTKVNRVIGKDNKLPWHLPEDLKHFKEITLYKNVVMGHNTWKSIPDKFKPLPNRNNIVLSKTLEEIKGYNGNVCVFSSIDEILHIYPDIYVIGGATIYNSFLNRSLVDRIIASEIYNEYDGDAYFPKIEGFSEIRRSPNNGFDIVDYERKKHEE